MSDTTRSIVVRLQAEISGFKKGFADASAAVSDAQRKIQADIAGTDTAMGKVAKSVAVHGQEWDQLGNRMALAGAAIGGALALTAREAINWESAWAGVTKTVDGSAAEMAQLETGLRDLTKVLPASHSEIAAVAEAAGQLGVKQKDILGFTKTMIDLGETTNLSADEAATAIAQISNVMGTLDREGATGVSRFAASLVELGNNGASTERDIVSMATRIAGAAKVVGMSEQELLAISNALSSVGVEAEAGGTAVSKVLMDMSKAVTQGSDDLDKFARVAGVSAEQFAAAFRESPGQAMAMFVEGLDKITKSGGDTFTTLDELGFADIRVSSSLLKMAGAGDLLRQSLDDSGRAWQENSAHTDEAAKRYETTAAKLDIAKNAAREAAIDLGSALAPAIASVAEGAASAAGAIADIPAPLQHIGLIAASAAAGALLLGGGLIKIGTSGYEAYRALATLRADLPGVATGLDKVSGAAKVAGKVFAVLGAAAVLSNLGKEEAAGVEQFTQAIIGSSDAVAGLNSVLAKFEPATSRTGGELENFSGIVQSAFNPSMVQDIDNFFGAIQSGLGGSNLSDFAYANEQIDTLDSALSQLVSGGYGDKAGAIFEQIAAAAAEQGVTIDELKVKFPQYAEALAAVDNQNALAGGSAKGLAGNLGEVGGAATLTGEEIDKLADKIRGFGDTVLTQRSASREWEAALDDLSEAIATNGTAMGDQTAEGRANEAMIDDLVQAAKEKTAAELEATDSAARAAAVMRDSREAFIAATTVLYGSAEAAAAMADKLGLIPEDVETQVSTPGATQSQQEIQDLGGYINGLPPYAYTDVSTPGATNSQNEILTLDGYINGLPPYAYTNVSAPGAVQSKDQIWDVNTALTNLPPSKSTQVSAPGADTATASVSGLNWVLSQLPTYKVVTVETRNVTINDIYYAGKNADGGIWGNSGGTLVRAYADGGFHAPSIGSMQPQIRPAGGQGILWAEQGAGPWESFISGHPGKADRSQTMWRKTGMLLGASPAEVNAVRFANSGFYGSGGDMRFSPNGYSRLHPDDIASLGSIFASAIDGARLGLPLGQMLSEWTNEVVLQASQGVG